MANVEMFDDRLPMRFWEKVQLDTASGCWLWLAYVDECGYARLRAGRPGRKGHRVAFEATRGVIPAGFEIDHLCRTRSCVNPNHLEVVTHAENVRRSNHPHAPKVACKRGHVFSAETTYLSMRHGRQVRQCRICTIERNRAWRASHSVK